MSSKALFKSLLFSLALVTGGGARAEERLFTVAEARSDFQALYRGLQEAQYDLFAHTPKRELDKAFQKHLAGIVKPMTLFDMQTGFQLFVAKVKIAHTRIDFPTQAYRSYLQGGGRSFPFEVRIDEGRVFVVRNRSGLSAIAPGDEIVAMNGQPMNVWLSRLSARVSGDTTYLRHSIVEYRLPGLLWLELGPVAEFDLKIKGQGRARSVRVPARTEAEQDAFGKAQPKLFSLDQGRSYRILDGNIGYLRPGPFYNDDPKGNMWDNVKFKAFIDEAFESFLKAGVDTLVVDVRDNPGGDGSFSDHMVAWFADRPFKFVRDFRIKVSAQTIASNRKRMAEAAAAGIPDPISPQFDKLLSGAPIGSIVSFDVPTIQPRTGKRFNGKIYLMIDRNSYSNTVNVAALVQDYKFGTLVGEPTTDMATTYGAMEHFSLPISNLSIGYAKAMLIRPNGTLQSAGVTPDVRIHTPVVEVRDEVLDKTLQYVRSHRGAAH